MEYYKSVCDTTFTLDLWFVNLLEGIRKPNAVLLKS